MPTKVWHEGEKFLYQGVPIAELTRMNPRVPGHVTRASERCAAKNLAASSPNLGSWTTDAPNHGAPIAEEAAAQPPGACPAFNLKTCQTRREASGCVSKHGDRPNGL